MKGRRGRGCWMAPLLQKQSHPASPSPAGASGEKGVSFDGRLWVVSAALSA